MWEAGYSMALGKPTILIGQNVTELPFDLKVHRVLSYRREDLNSLTQDLRRALQQTVERYEIRASVAQGWRRKLETITIAVTGSMTANAEKTKRRIDLLLSPYLGKQVLWYSGSNGVVDQAAVRFLVSRKERVVAVGYSALDLADEIKRMVEDGSVQFMDASVESIPQTLMGLPRRDRMFVTKADLLAIFWDGESKGTQALIRCCQETGKNLLLGFI
jgi:hypothetical protein